MTLDNSKSEEGQGDYRGKTRKLFKTIRIQVMRHEFLKFLPWQGPVRGFDLSWNVFNEGLYKLHLLSVEDIENQLCLST